MFCKATRWSEKGKDSGDCPSLTNEHTSAILQYAANREAGIKMTKT